VCSLHFNSLDFGRQTIQLQPVSSSHWLPGSAGQVGLNLKREPLQNHTKASMGGAAGCALDVQHQPAGASPILNLFDLCHIAEFRKINACGMVVGTALQFA
jgi:hypothetical protein